MTGPRATERLRLPGWRRLRARRRISLACLAGGLAVASLLVVAKPARAAGGIQYGYWWEGEPAGGGVPPPSTVPENGLWISSNPSGPQAISAVQVQLAPGEENSTLTLKVHQAEPPGGVPAAACPARGTWKPVESGAWSDRPQADCGRGSILGSTSSDGSNVSFALGPLVGPDGVVNVVLLPQALTTPATSSSPATPTDSGPSSTMDASFEALSPQSVAASSSTPAGQPAGASPVGGEQLPAPSDQGLGGAPLGSSTPDNGSPLVTGVALPASPGLTGAAPQQSGGTAAGSGPPQPVGQIRPSAPMIRLSLVQREVLDVVLLLLLAVALGEPIVGLLPARVPIVGGKLSLHDNPSASGHLRKGASRREGRAPPLR